MENGDRSRPRRRTMPPIRFTLYEDERLQKRTPMSNTDRSRARRMLFEEKDPLGFEKWKREQADKKILYRQQVKEENGERLQIAREKARIRAKRYRDNKKANGIISKHPQNSKRSQTRAEKKKVEEDQAKKRAYWAERKRIQRAKQTAQKKRRIRERDRARKAEVRVQKKQKKSMQATKNLNCDESDFPSASAAYKAISRVKSRMPQQSSRYATIVKRLLSPPTPRRKAALQDAGLSFCRKKLDLASATAEALKEVRGKKASGNLLQNIAKKLKSKALMRFASRSLDIDRNFLRRCSHIPEEPAEHETKRPRGKCLKREIEDSIKNFYYRADISTELPHKKSVKNMRAGRVMTISLQAAWEVWTEESGYSVALSTFASRRPDDIKLLHSMPLTQCLCEYCANIELKLHALNKVAKTTIIKDRYALLAVTQCPKGNDGHYRRQCYERKCNNCGPQALKETFSVLDKTTKMEWKVWDKVEEEYNGKKIRKQKLLDRKGNVEKCLQELITEAGPFAKHMFVARWQYQQFQKACSPEILKRNTVLFVMDFAQNYTVQYQGEIQAAHWGKTAITLHPVIAFYKCPNDQTIIREAIDIISDDLCHDYHAVNSFMDKARQHLTQNQGIEIEREIQFSDGCGAQYKSRGPFADISFNPAVERNYFGSRHGKGPCDGEGGVMKCAVDRGIRGSRATVRDAEEMAQFLDYNYTKQGEGCQHSRRKIIYVPTGDILRERPTRLITKSLPGTMSLQVVKSVKPGVVNTRNLTCFCEGCEQSLDCSNKEHVDKFKTGELKMANPLLQDCHRSATKMNTHVGREEQTPLETEVAGDSEVEAMDIDGDEPDPDNVAGVTANDATNVEAEEVPVATEEDATSVPADHAIPDAEDCENEEGGRSTSEDNNPSWKIDDWLLVEYDGKNYPGRVAALEDTETQVDCMEPSGAYWKWPNKKDLAWYTLDKVVKILSPPIPASTTRGQISKFMDM